DLYYRHPALFGTQAVVDRYVDDIACTFGVPRAALHVTAAAKGLVAGAFNLCNTDGTLIESGLNHEGMLIRNFKNGETVDMISVEWILVIEKEATFRTLASSDFWDTIRRRAIVLTAKGYPDIASRSFLRLISSPSFRNRYCSPPVYALVDFDPDGISIYSTYKYGSLALAHENHNLNTPAMQWIGVKSSDLFSIAAEADLHEAEGLLRLSLRDRSKAQKLIERHIDSESDTDSEFICELQTMLMLNVKAEIQILEAKVGGLGQWLGRQSFVKGVMPSSPLQDD
ncbi:DNA topoisomerase IV, alpha subunit, partial [Rhizodiscina lignyota]